MINKVNKALDKGWRLREVGPPGHWCLIPPDVLQEDLGYETKLLLRVHLYIPKELLEAWLKAHVIISPEEKKQHDLKERVKTWLHAEWPGYLEECDDDADYAKILITSDAAHDFRVDKDDVVDWLQEVRDARNK